MTDDTGEVEKRIIQMIDSLTLKRAYFYCRCREHVARFKSFNCQMIPKKLQDALCHVEFAESFFSPIGFPDMSCSE